MSICFMLTAGEGRRLRPFTEKKPKPAIEFLTLPLCYYGFYLAKHAGFDKFLFNKHHLPEVIDQLVSQLQPMTDSIATSDESGALLGSGGAIWKAKDILKKYDYFLVANGDEILLPDNPEILQNLVNKFKTDQALCTLLTCDHPELLKSLKPVWVNQDSEVKGFGMNKPADGVKPVHYTGYKVFSSKILDILPEGESNIFYDVLINSIAQGEKVTHYHIGEVPWFETGNFQSFLKASEQTANYNFDLIQKRLEYFNRPFLQVVSQANGQLVCPQDFQQNEIEYSGHVVVAANSKLASGTKLENCIVQSGASIEIKNTYSSQILF